MKGRMKKAKKKEPYFTERIVPQPQWDKVLVRTKPMLCPFCGGEGSDHTSIFMRHFVKCRSCDAYGPLKQTKQSAMKAWNRRAE